MNIAIKSLKGILSAVVFSFSVCSCEQVITVKLQDEQPHLVIEGTITNGDGPFIVRLSESQEYFNQSGFTGIEKAMVQINDSTMTETLTENGSGYYSTNKIRGIPRKSYQLNATVQGNKYNASVMLPPPVPIDTVYFDKSLFHPDSLNAFLEFHDPLGIENFYRIKLSRNGRFNVKDYFLVTDITSDGQRLWVPIYYREFAPGDSVVVELENLERSTYLYLKSLNEIVRQGVNVQAPGNPPSNISGGALGYFGAWGTSSFSAYIPK
jgi:hypothetical protein